MIDEEGEKDGMDGEREVSRGEGFNGEGWG